jgi:light-regulated signal transduction histidine kinase (bacteriophytochrome)
MIQAFGVLLALQPTTDGRYCVYASSNNTLQSIGYSPENLFAQDDFCQFVVEDHKLDFRRRLQSLFNVELEADRTATDVFHVSLMALDRRSRDFWCTAHVSNEPKDTIICELGGFALYLKYKFRRKNSISNPHQNAQLSSYKARMGKFDEKK